MRTLHLTITIAHDDFLPRLRCYFAETSRLLPLQHQEKALLEAVTAVTSLFTER